MNAAKLAEIDTERHRKQFIPFEFVVGDDVDEIGMTKDEQEQRVRYPEHMNIRTRIDYNPLHHRVTFEQGSDGYLSAIVFTPLGTGEMNDVVK